MAGSPGDQVAKIILVFVGVAALNAFRRGELGDWARAKFLNWGDPAPAGTVTFSQILTNRAEAGTREAGATITAGVEDAAGAVDLVQVGNTKMSRRFADRWRPMQQAAARDGIILTGSAHRSKERQVQLRIAHGCGGARIYDRSCKGNPPTAVPGHSRHETGDAIDVVLTGGGGRTSPEFRWLAKNAGRYGIYNLPSEPWHWSIDGK